jgi:signal transduction histidine kinase
MTNSAPLSRLLSDRRLFPVIEVIPYVVVAALIAFTIVVDHDHRSRLIVSLVLSGITTAWMIGLFSIPRRLRARQWFRAVFVVGVIVLFGVEVAHEAWFGVFAVAGFIYAFALLPWPWRLLGVAAVAAIAGLAQASGIPKTTSLGITATIAIVFINVLAMCLFCWIQWTSDELGVERSKALEEVRAANARLEASLAENAALQEQLVTRARQAGMLDERARMAREIHDTLAQGLIGIITQLEAAELAGSDPGKRRQHFDAASALARESLSDARRSVSALRPEALESARLSDALVEVAERWSARQGIPVQVTTTGTVEPVASEAEVALLRAAQEALANVAKHADAGRVGVTLSYLTDEVALDVRDDGIGFDPARPVAGAGGFGLVALRERVEQLSGSVQVESEPGHGTAVSVRVPVTPGVQG